MSVCVCRCIRAPVTLSFEEIKCPLALTWKTPKYRGIGSKLYLCVYVRRCRCGNCVFMCVCVCVCVRVCARVSVCVRA